MKTTKSVRVLKCCKYLAVFYLVFNCFLGLCTSTFASYLFIFGQEGKISKPKIIVLCFLFVPGLYSLLSTFLGWLSIKKKSTKLLRVFAVLLAAAVILQITGCLWCFTSLPQINEQVLTHMQEKFSTVALDSFSEKWWSDIQIKLKCCGLYGPSDYYSIKAVPVSCCGSDPENKTNGSCSFLWQKGCSYALTQELSKDLTLLGLIGLCFALLQVPGVFITWCLATKISKDNIKNVLKLHIRK